MREVSWNDYYSMHYVGMPDYCGQAEAVCYTVTVPEKRRYLQSIVWQDLKSGKKRTVSAGGSTETFARFSPESKSSRIILAFLSDADGTSQIYRYVCSDKDWEESCEKLTDIPGGVRESGRRMERRLPSWPEAEKNRGRGGRSLTPSS